MHFRVLKVEKFLTLNNNAFYLLYNFSFIKFLNYKLILILRVRLNSVIPWAMAWDQTHSINLSQLKLFKVSVKIKFQLKLTLTVGLNSK